MEDDAGLDTESDFHDLREYILTEIASIKQILLIFWIKI